MTTRLVGQLAVAAVVLVLAGAASARAPRPPVCRDGRFVTPPGAPPLIAGAIAATPEALVIGGATPTISIAGHCPAVRVRLKATKTGTKVVASWPRNACGPARVQLRAMIDAACHAMRGVLRASKSAPVRFVAPRCGDGTMDPVDGEVCDGAAGCGAGQECSPDCRCVELSRPPTTPVPVSFEGEVQPIFTNRCAVPFCHSGAFPTQGLDLSDGNAYGAIVNVLSTERPTVKRIDPCLPMASYLLWKVGKAPEGETIVGLPMPLTGGPLTLAQVATIRDWVAQGALNDQPPSTTSTTVTSTTVVTVPSTSTTVETVTSTSTTSTTTTTEPPLTTSTTEPPTTSTTTVTTTTTVAPTTTSTSTSTSTTITSSTTTTTEPPVTTTTEPSTTTTATQPAVTTTTTTVVEETTSTTVTSTSTTVVTVTTTSTTVATVTSTSTTSTTTTQPTLASFRGDVQPIFTDRCAVPFCHSGVFPAQGLDLSDGNAYGAIVNVLSTERPTVKRIDPGLPTASYLLWKVGKAPEGEMISGLQMPFGAPLLTLAQVATIRDWVTQGALDN